MAASTICPKCGFMNQAGWTFCANCGSPAVMPGGMPPAGGTPAPLPAYPAYPGTGYGASPWEADRQKQIGRTKTGVLLLLLGALISWVPIIGGLGALLTFIGAILVILGRKAFGAAHRRNVVISIVLFFVGIVVLVGGAILAVVAAFAGLSPSPTEAELTAALSSAFTNVVIIAAVGTLISGLAGIFFTYALQKKEGRILLFAAYGASVAIQIVGLVIVVPALQAAAPGIAHQIVTSGTFDSSAISSAISTAVRDAEGSLPLLSVIPSLLYAAAAYLAYSRINLGEIPPPAVPPGMPTGMSPPSGPSPPM